MTEDKIVKNSADKTFNRLFGTSVLALLLCVVCLCSTTYAWFTATISHGGNEIVTASSCLLTVTVDGGEDSITVDGASTNTVEITEDDGATALALRGGDYTVTLSLPKDSPSGYLLLTAHGVDYRSPFISRHEENTPKVVTFNLSVTGDTNVEMLVRWGIYSLDASVENGGTLII